MSTISGYFNNYIAEPGLAFAQAAGDLIQQSAEGLYQGACGVEAFWNARNAQVKDWTEENLPKPIAKIAQAFAYALPATALWLAAPSLVIPTLLAYTAFKAVQIIRGDTSFAEMRRTIVDRVGLNSLGFACAVEGAAHIGIGVITQNASSIGLGIFGIAISVVPFAISGLLDEVLVAAIEE